MVSGLDRHSSFIALVLVVFMTVVSGYEASAQVGYIPPKGNQPSDIPKTESARRLAEMQKDSEKDTTSRKAKVRKPLESFYFDDSLRAQGVFSWGVSMSDNSVHRKVVDTLLDDFRNDYRFMRDGVGSATIGNLGGASIPLNFFKRPQYSNFSFLQAWDPFILTPERVTFYNAKMPYTRLSYEMSGQRKIEENLFNVILSQNISPSTSVGVEYNADGTRGMYLNQKTLDRYFTVNLAHTGKRYAIHAGYIYNMGNVNENGGVVDDRSITDTVIPLTDNIPVHLRNANNTYKGHTFYFVQSYAIPLRKQREDELTVQKIPTIYVGQSFEYSKFRKLYSATGDTSYYKKSYINETQSRDSINQSMLDIKLFAQLQPYNRNGVVGLITGGIGNEYNQYYYWVPVKYRAEYGQGGVSARNSTYVYGGIGGQVSKYMAWDAQAKYFLAGYRSQDLDLDGKLTLSAFIKEKPLILEAGIKFTLREPDFWSQNYFSNHFAWSNSFSKENETRINAKFMVPSIGLELGGDYAMLQNKVYYDNEALPQQFTGMLNVMGLYLQKNFRLGGFHFNHRVLMQWSSDQSVAPVPMFSAYLSYFFMFDVVKNVLKMQIGIDGRYNTEYYGFGYNPATAQFYNQREKKVGGYPYLDAFVTAKWKRMRILVKAQHLNANLFGSQNYFMVAGYPANRMMLKFGISWSFYD